VVNEPARDVDDASRVATNSDSQYLYRLATLIRSRLGERRFTPDEAVTLIDSLVRPTVRSRRLAAAPSAPTVASAGLSALIRAERGPAGHHRL
jgi:hypothetical protein